MSRLSVASLAFALLLVIKMLLLAPVQAQFFQQFFGGNGGGSMFGSREQEPPPAGDASWFEARVDAAQCTQYLCPRTLSCVSKPSHCPCPFPQQIRCSYKDASSSAKDHVDRAGGTFDGVDAALDLGGTFCVTAESCEEVDRILQAKA
ncbi:hypothetical protein PSEUBRA_005791 [Kalmanozyma brasiliensis GHG001]|uniref:Long chronological lifespan protein 2 n=1 Tax=Kalmanozyma brasiliensis (strain GHG001) TaxID=1365824 RepID=V5ESR8_KALBG|nr:uncharacterized protein PSEUBRA_005791 [Kalmanozyma brasiliensis GHG001]EST04989.1 hypothetical protein PSEUBRA_005791 [Kalmanozyma brasiliensis GHG001]